MSDLHWKSPLAGVVKPGQHAVRGQSPGVVICEMRRALYSISPYRDRRARVSDILHRHFGMTLPEPGHFHHNQESSLLWAGFGQWMLAGPPGGTLDIDAAAGELGDCAALVALGDSRAMLRLSGPATRQVLARLCALDLHPRRFSSGHCAATRMGHLSALLHQIDDEPTFEIHVFRAFAASLYHELTEAAREFGYQSSC
jgi:heterotetrameric sarcosine oxidase gamma subunit